MTEQAEMPLDDMQRWRAKHAKALGRGKHYTEARGYAAPPGTGPAGETCGSCKHGCQFKRWWKCGLMRRVWTGGRKTDILARAPACSKWESKVDEKPPVVITTPNAGEQVAPAL